MQPTIYIIDADPRVLETVARLVKPSGANVETFRRAGDFLSKLHDEGPACLVLEVRLPDMSGLELQALLNERGCQIPIIFLAGDADIQTAVDAMKAGAVNFFEKPFRPHKLFDEILRILRNGIEAWQHRDQEQDIEQRLASLKPREREVLDRIAAGKTNEEIAQELKLSLSAVEKRRANAMKNLRIDSRAELLHLLHVLIPIKPRKCLRCGALSQLT